MSLRTKVLCFVGALLVLRLLIIFLVPYNTVLDGFRSLQEDHTRQQLQQASVTIRSEISEVGRILVDWSSWDDSYQFVVDRNPNYIASNLVDTTFGDPGLRLNAMLFLNTAGEEVFSKGFDFANNVAMPLPGGLVEQMAVLGAGLSEPAGIRGLIATDTGIAVVAAAPILNSLSQGPSRGTLVMTRMLDSAEIQNLSERVGFDMALEPLVDADLPVTDAVSDTGSIEINAGIASASQVLTGLDGQALARLVVMGPATIMQRGDETVATYGWTILFSGIPVLILLVLIIEYLVTRRVMLLNRKVEEVSAGSDQSVLLGGNDELTSLSRRIDEMINRLRDIEQRRVTSERLRVAGELTAGVSHNLNNMLNGIVGPAELLARSVTGERETKLLDVIRKSGARATRLVEQLNHVVRPHNRSNNQIIDVNSTVQEALQIAGPRWHDEAQLRGVRIQVVDDLNDVSSIKGNEGALVDVLLNLLFNAIDAMPDGGTLGVHTFEDSNGVNISVTDTGIGMSDDVKMRAFEPFFTTKVTVGTGLGLATVKATVESWGGSIVINTQPGVGTEFRLCFPTAMSTARATAQAPVTKVTGGRRILVIEDDNDVRETMLLLLAESDVVGAANGEEGVALAGSQNFDVALIDLGLPDITGDQVASRIRDLQPGVIRVLVSGWQIPDNDPRLACFDYYLMKPVMDAEQIYTAIDQARQQRNAQ